MFCFVGDFGGPSLRAQQLLDAPLCIWDARRVDEAGSGEGASKRVGAAAAAVAAPGTSSTVSDTGLGSASGVPAGGSEKKFVGFVGPMSARWSDHYKANPREPENTELAWWVKGAIKGAK